MRRNLLPSLAGVVGTAESATAIGGGVGTKATTVRWTESSANELSMRVLSTLTPSMMPVAEQVGGNTSVYADALIAVQTVVR